VRDEGVRESIRTELEATRLAFHALLDSLPDEELGRQSLNAGWTNAEVLFHIVLAFILLEPLVPMARIYGRLPPRYSRPQAWLLDAITGPFNWINALGARLGGRVLTRPQIRARYDHFHRRALKMIETIRDDEWQRGMFYPARWDPLFSDFMTLEQVFRFPEAHFRFHAGQIAR
jgi:hypothetical protein